MKQNQKILRMVEMAMLLALVVILQMFSFPLGPFKVSMVLIPVVIGSIVFGPKGGSFFGAVFGMVVLIQCAVGMDPGGAILWSINPFFTSLICLVKGIAAGLFPGLIYRALTKISQTTGFGVFAAVVASISAPIANTGLFLVGLSVCFHSTLVEWAGGTNMLVYILTGLVGFNFLFEFIANLVVSPAISTIVNLVNKKKF